MAYRLMNKEGTKTKEIAMFDINKVIKVYSGRKGCACGCLGKYSYASAFKHMRPDYMKGEEGVSDRSVRTIVARVEDMLRNPNSAACRILLQPDFIAVDLDYDRTYTIYFAEDTAESYLISIDEGQRLALMAALRRDYPKDHPLEYWHAMLADLQKDEAESPGVIHGFCM